MEEQLYQNLIKRYTKAKNYAIVRMSNDGIKQITKKVSLLFIEFFTLDRLLISDIEKYLKGLKNLILENINLIETSGFIAIQTKDIRIDGYVEPLAKRIASVLEQLDKIRLKEIIILTTDKDMNNENLKETKQCLEITHQYLLIYQKE